MDKGVSFADHRDALYFTIDGYRAILSRALELGYDIVPFRKFEPPGDRPVLLLRHDLDHSLTRVLPLAQIENELGLASTFFVQTACEYYNLLADTGRQLIRRLVSMGHEIGLHYSSEHYQGSEGRRRLAGDLRLLEDLSGNKVVSAAQHLPIDGDPVDLSDYVLNEAYEPRFTTSRMTYISDSLMTWRQATPHDLLDKRVSFQFLSHPESWCATHRNMEDLLDDILKEESEGLRSRYSELTGYYRQLLAERQERDQRFRKRSNPLAQAET
jgi:hypothetical protein